MRKPDRPWTDQEQKGFRIFLLALALLTGAVLHLCIMASLWIIRHS